MIKKLISILFLFFTFTITQADIKSYQRLSFIGKKEADSRKKIYVVGDFNNINNTNMPRLARLNSDWSLDTSFGPFEISGSEITAIEKFSDGSILVGGNLTTSNSFLTINNLTTRVARINYDGSLNTNFIFSYFPTNVILSAIKILNDDTILVGFNGIITNINNTAVPNTALHKLTSNGDLINSFAQSLQAASVVGQGERLEILPNGNILMFGTSTPLILNTTRRGAVIFNQNGVINPNFTVGTFNLLSRTATRINNDYYYIGGNLSVPNQRRLTRTNPNGSFDTTFFTPLAISNSANVTLVKGVEDNKVLSVSTISTTSRVYKVNFSPSTIDTNFFIEFTRSPFPLSGALTKIEPIYNTDYIFCGGLDNRGSILTQTDLFGNIKTNLFLFGDGVIFDFVRE
jgi:hypothetical protein